MRRHAVSIVREAFDVHPVVLALRRVVGEELIEHIAAAHERLVDVAHFLHPRELVELFEPDNADIAVRRLQGFDFMRIVHAEEIDFLPRAPVRDFIRRFPISKGVREAELVDAPLDLRVDAVLDRVADFPQDDGVHLGMTQKQQRDLDRDERGFCRAAPAAQPIERMAVALDVTVHRVKGRRDDGIQHAFHPSPPPCTSGMLSTMTTPPFVVPARPPSWMAFVSAFIFAIFAARSMSLPENSPPRMRK